MRYAIERDLLAGIGRMPGLKSSNLGLEVLENRLNKLDPEDYMHSRL
jgi:Proteasome maturation factor UMP1